MMRDYELARIKKRNREMAKNDENKTEFKEHLEKASKEHLAREAKHKIRTFGSGATRDTDEGKLDFEAALSPIVIERYVQYMCKNKLQADGMVRECDNWQGLFGQKHLNVCVKSAMRHLWSWWKAHRGYRVKDGLEDAICGVIFNAMAYLFKILNERADRDIEVARQAQNDSSIEAGLVCGDKSKANKAKAGLDEAFKDDSRKEYVPPKLGPKCSNCENKMQWNEVLSLYICRSHLQCHGNTMEDPNKKRDDKLAPRCAKCNRIMSWNVTLGAMNCFRCDGYKQSTPIVREESE